MYLFRNGESRSKCLRKTKKNKGNRKFGAVTIRLFKFICDNRKVTTQLVIFATRENKYSIITRKN